MAKPELLPSVTIDPQGTVRVFVDGINIDLTYRDYQMACISGKSPLSRVFSPSVPKIALINEVLDDDES